MVIAIIEDRSAYMLYCSHRICTRSFSFHILVQHCNLLILRRYNHWSNLMCWCLPDWICCSNLWLMILCYIHLLVARYIHLLVARYIHLLVASIHVGGHWQVVTHRHLLTRISTNSILLPPCCRQSNQSCCIQHQTTPHLDALKVRGFLPM